MKLRKFKTVKGILGGIQKLYTNPKHWTQGVHEDKLQDGTVCYCLSGAAKALAANNNIFEQVMDTLNKVIRKVTSRHYDGVIEFNDSPRRTISSIRAIVSLARKAA